MNKDKVMEIVTAMCNMESEGCRSLNKSNMARKLMNFINVPESASIQEIPLDWDSQVGILFKVPNDNNYYGLYAGMGKDSNYFFDLTVMGVFDESGEFNFYDTDKQISINHFMVA